MTIAEQWNAGVGRKIFAERVDVYGLPDGGWAIPTITCKQDIANRRVRMFMGTFRRRGDRMQCASVMLDIEDLRIAMRDMSDLAQIPAELLTKLLAKIEEFDEPQSSPKGIDHKILKLTLAR